MAVLRLPITPPADSSGDAIDLVELSTEVTTGLSSDTLNTDTPSGVVLPFPDDPEYRAVFHLLRLLRTPIRGFSRCEWEASSCLNVHLDERRACIAAALNQGDFSLITGSCGGFDGVSMFGDTVGRQNFLPAIGHLYPAVRFVQLRSHEQDGEENLRVSVGFLRSFGGRVYFCEPSAMKTTDGWNGWHDISEPGRYFSTEVFSRALPVPS